jgi:hypothetical protein
LFLASICFLEYGSRQEIITRYCAELWLVCKAHPAAQIEIRVVGCNAVDGTKVKQAVELLFIGALSITCQYSIHISSIARKVVEKGSADCMREQKALL